MNSLLKQHRLLFYICWIILGIVQMSMTELQDDEAYYWVYSKYPAWGYFDHPPLIAMLIKGGYAIFPNELGVRLFPFLLHILTLFIIELLTERRAPGLFYTIALSLGALQLTGFLAVPDTPLVFSTAFFFLAYKHFLKNPDIIHILLLGLACALLVYSKYHGLLVIAFTLLSNLRLFLQGRTYVVALTGFLLLLPHINWQFSNGFETLRYHLVESNVNSYKTEFTLSFIVGQLLLAGPIAGFLLIPAAFRFPTAGKLERALKFCLAGFYIFFFLSSIRGKVEMNWTAPILVPLFVLSHGYLLTGEKWKQLLFKLLPITVVLVVTARIFMITDILPVNAIKKRYHAWDDWPEKMKEKTGSIPIVFSNSYQRASKYWFYTGQMAYSQNLYKEHRNQFDLLPVKHELTGKEVAYLDIYDLSRFPDSMATPLGYVGYIRIPSFFPPELIKLKAEHIEGNAGDTLTIRISLTETPSYILPLVSRGDSSVTLSAAIFKHKKWLKDILIPVELSRITGKNVRVKLMPQLSPGNYEYLLAVKMDPFHPVRNSSRYKLIIR